MVELDRHFFAAGEIGMSENFTVKAPTLLQQEK